MNGYDLASIKAALERRRRENDGLTIVPAAILPDLRHTSARSRETAVTIDQRLAKLRVKRQDGDGSPGRSGEFTPGLAVKLLDDDGERRAPAQWRDGEAGP